MTVLLATVGYTPEKVTHALPREGALDAVTLFYGSAANRATARAVGTIRKACRPLGLPVKEVELGSAYDFVAAVAAYRREARAHAGKDVLFNLSGGTGVMQAAASFVCFTEGIPSVYYNREERVYVRMPHVRLAAANAVSPQQRRILGALKGAPSGLFPSDLARRLRLSPSHLDYHLRRLRGQGLVHGVPVEGSKRERVAVTDLCVLLVDEG